MALEGLKLKAAQRRQAAYDKAINSPVDYVREEALRQYREDSWQAHRFDAALLRKALAEARKAERTFDTRTCQICGRAIKASSGLIAHHGYERPGWGYQTTSCLGARKCGKPGGQIYYYAKVLRDYRPCLSFHVVASLCAWDWQFEL